VDGNPVHGYLWDALQNTSYALDYVNDRDTAADPLELSLGVGNHTVVVYQRDDGTRLDKLELERVMGGYSSGGGRLSLLSQPRLVKRAVNALTKVRLLVAPPEGTVYRSYYYAGSQRVAVRETTASESAVYYLLGDHLGSSSITTDSNGNKISELRYAWGDPNTDRRFTGQRYDGYISSYWFGSRWYDPYLSQFTQPDSIIPDPYNPLDWNRYAYARYNPARYKDPTGHWIESVFDIASIAYDIYDISKNGLNWGTGLALVADVGGLILPGVTGGGMAVRALTHADDVVDVVKAVDTAGDVIQTANQAGNAVQAANQLDNLADTSKIVGDICSFSEDTLVSTKDGYKPISEVKTGDLVLAFDIKEGEEEISFYPVIETLVHTDPTIVQLRIDEELIQTTPDHPFFTSEHRWIPAGELWTGAKILEADGDYGEVKDIKVINQPQVMYNLTVAYAHTFYVGQDQWLVHNSCSDLRKALGITDPNVAAHHLIPQSMADHPAVRMATEAGWNMDHAYNGIGLPVDIHAEVPGHPGYNQYILNQLDDLYDRAVVNGWSAEDMYDELMNLADNTRARFGGGQ
jgi:RHS repeat-associated protein